METIDIIAITETHLQLGNKDLLCEYMIDGFKYFYKDRANGRQGGGVGLFINNKIKVTEVKLTESNVELVCVTLHLQDFKINISTVYRRPSTTINEDFELYSIMEETLNADEALLLGDFNLPDINWNLNTGTNQQAKLMIDFIENNYLHQCVMEPTRGRNILDLVITSQENLVSNITVGEHLGTCDHRLIRFDLNAKYSTTSNYSQAPDYSRANFDGLREALVNIHEQLIGLDDVNETWKKFKELFYIAQNNNVPFKTRNSSKNKNKPPWYNQGIGSALRERNRLHKLLKQNTCEQLIEQYTNSRRKVKKLIRSAKRQYEIDIAKACTTNPKHFYNYINKNKQMRSGIGPLKNQVGDITSDDMGMANILNDYFSSVFTVCNSSSDNNTNIDTQSRQPLLRNLEINPQLVLDKLKKLNANKTPGPDKFYPKILKNVQNEIAEPLALIFSKSLEQGIVPDDWRIANVTPIFKKGSKSQASNYRPISLTSVVGKLLETILRDKIVDFLEVNNLIRDSQHGFRSKRSCLTNLIDFYHNLFNIYNDTKSLDIIYLDFKKAFDKIPHQKLMNKVKMIGIDGEIHRWVSSWLRDRKQRVVINGVESDWVSVTSGVPQGSVLGPILFTIYINDIDVGVNNIISKFADDTKIGNSIISEEDRANLQADINKITEWSEKWQMPFNVDKCQILQCGSKNKKYNYEMQGHPLSTTSQVKDLGVIISENLKTSNQCAAAANKANRALGYIKRNFTYKSEDIILPLYKSIVRPHLEYAVQFWAPHLIKDIEKLEAVQHRATKLIPSLRSKPYHERLNKLKLFSVKKRRLRGQLIECFKTLKGLNNVDASRVFTLVGETSTRGHNLKLQGKRANLDIIKNFYTYSIINEWNNLPNVVVDSITINTFKKRLDNHLEIMGIV